MIVSHRHKFIFMHCRKVAGSSVKVALAPALGPEDIVVGSLHELEAAGHRATAAVDRILSRPGARLTTLAAALLGKPWPEARNIALKRHFGKVLGPNPPHPTAERAAQYLVAEWPHYYKFAFVRNPYDQVASDYFWRRRATGKAFTFSEYVSYLQAGDTSNGILPPEASSNWDMIAIDGVVVMDKVGRYENLSQDFGEISEELGLRGVELKPVAKRGAHRDQYGELYGAKEKAVVEDLFRNELEHFGYEFPYSHATAKRGNS